MTDKCQACKRAAVEVVDILEDPAEPLRVCDRCHIRLLAHSLRPAEWYNLCVIHGSSNNLLGYQYYRQEDGSALQPAEEVTDAARFPCPTLEEERQFPERLLAYVLSRDHRDREGPVGRWYVREEFISAMRSYPPDVWVSVLAQRLAATRNIEMVWAIFRLTGLVLGNSGAALVRDCWEQFASSPAFTGIAFAAAKCLPLEEAHERVADALDRMEAKQRCSSKTVLHYFKSALNLDWIEKNIVSPVDITWGGLAASSKFDWERAKKWLSMGRPLSLVSLDALHWCVCGSRKPPLPVWPSAQEFRSTLQAYLLSDNVPRVRERIDDLLKYGPSA